ncbi:hemolysin family protein [Nesterenkonia halophila]|uniref:CNNM domain-containing protein n=1 Tax=Nesterenkonia halophila TaxID=302044 RepID=UPI0012913CF6|nr:hemolysin family protein [Nesterenkonia halophila]
MTAWIVPTVATLAIIALSAFFVVLEFSMLAARRHRLEEAAETSRSARAALRGLNELTVMLAAAQLGITACTFALGAVSKPAVHHALAPLLEATALPLWAADAVSFTVALLLMTFLHLVVGEMAPKSWAIAHPERSARLVAVPARALARLLHPLLSVINGLANRLVSAAGVEPVDRAAVGGYDSETIHQLIRHSTDAGALDEASGGQLTQIIALETLPVEEVNAGRRRSGTTSLPAGATMADVQRAAAQTAHLRILLHGDRPADDPRIVHVRDTLTADPQDPAVEVSRPTLVLPPGTPAPQVLQRMRETGEQLVVVRTEGRPLTGVVTWNDILRRVWPESARQA